MRKIYLLALIAFAFASFGAMPTPPSGWEGCVVAGYSETTGSVSSVRKASSAKTVANVLLSASAPATSAAAAPIERKWVLRSAGGTNAQYVVKMTMQSNGEISMCAYSPNRVIVTLQKEKPYAEFVSQMEANGFTVVRKLMMDTNGNPVYIVKAADTETDLVESMTMGIQATGCCSMIKPDHIFTAGATPKDAKFSQQWGLVKIGAPTAWNTRTDASSVLVAVLDTGVNYNHMDLSGSMWINSGESAMPGNGTDDDANDIVDDLHGMECISGGNISGNPVDDNGHGSHCAGIIGAVSDRYGVCGVAWKANIMGLKFLNSEGKGYVSDAITCLQYATDKGVKIVNCSFGATDWDDYFYEQIKIMAAKGIILVCAAGNAENGEPARDNDEYPFYPCNYPVSNIVSVAATDENDNLANFSYFGANNVDIAAPGVNIYSTIHSGTAAYDYMDGTSMATPHVTGALALLMAEYPDESPYSIVERLYAAGADIAALAGKVRTGRRLDLANFFGLPAPVDITASQGDVADAVALYWANVAGALYYRVWRAETEGGEKTALSPWQTGLTFTDSTAEPGVTYYYYVQSAATETGGSASAYSSAVPGHRPELSSEEHVTVSFKPQGGSVASESSDYVVGKTYGTFPAAVYDGKVFLGWYTESIQGSRIDATQSARADLTELYAHWIDENEPRILNLFARQRYPWNGYVDVSFDLAGVAENHVADVSMIVDNGVDDQEVALSSWVGNGPTNLTNGAHAFVWDSASDASGILYTNMTLDATVSVRSLRPDAPTNVSASDGISSEAVLVSWNAVDTATSYDVYRYDSDCSVGAIGSLATKLGNVSTTNFTDNTAVAGLGYFYWIKAINSSGESDFSSSDRGYRKKVVESISIGGEATIIAGDSASLTCLATYNDKQNSVVVPTWSIYSGSGYLSIDTAGNITAQKVSSAGQAVVQASYTYGGITKVERKTISVTTRTVTITFDGNGGTPSFESKAYTSYGMFVTLPTATRSGYTFANWYTAATGGSWVMAATSVPDEATTYYAHWNKSTYAVTLDRQGGSGGISSVTATYDTAMPTITIPTRTGYTFGGYYTSTGGSGIQYYTASGTSARTWDKTSATTLYAKWSANSYAIRFDPNGGSGLMSDLPMLYNVTKTLPVNVFTMAGCRFVGWATSAGGLAEYEDGASVINLTAVNGGAVTLFAVWKEVQTVPALTIVSGKSTRGAELSWTPIEGATRYLIYRGETDNLGSALQINWESGTNHVDEYNGAVGGKTYYYWVRSVVGSVTNSFSVSKPGYRLVPDPQRIAATKGTYASSIAVTWNSSSGATSYRVYRHTTPNRADAVLVKTTTSTSFVDSSVAVGTRYYYWVEADGANGSSPRGAYDTGYAGTLVASVEPTHVTVGANYRVIDLSGGTGAASYPVYYLDAPPANGWTEEYKTTKLVMRLVPAGAFMMGSPEGEVGRDANENLHEVTLTEPYYIGIFPVTAEQWKLVCTNVPSSLSTVGSFPADNISYNGVRGKTNGAKWPQSADVDETSFLGFLRARTADGSFDLPTEAQWEMACRAGTDTAFNDGSDAVSELVDESLSSLGRYAHNGGANLNTSFYKVNVGLYKANALGIYDMHGLVGEWCRDWYAQNVSSLGDTDPVGPTSGWWGRVRRGGFDDFDASSCRSAARGYGSEGTVAGYGAPYGFRIISAVPEATVPSAPTGVTASQGTSTTETTVRWTEVSDATSYYIYRSKSNNSSLSTWVGTRTSGIFSDTTGVPGDVYYYWVKAHNDIGNSDFSEGATGYRKLSAPTGVSASDGASTSGATVSWASVSGATLYYVYRSASNISASAIQLGMTSATSYTDTTAVAGTTYYYWVKAYNGSSASFSAFSSSDSGYRQPSQCTVTLDQQSGSGGTASVTATYGSAMPAITVPTRTGYTFGGYYTSTGGNGTQYYTSVGASAKAWDKTSATTLYAKWTAVSVTVTLNQQSGSGGTASVTATYGSAMPAITVPTRTGYTFGGYYTSTGGSGTQYYTSAGASAKTWDKTSATTLYAKWTAVSVTVTLNQQSGSGGTASVTATYGSAMPAITVPTRTGYTFGGYYTSTGGSGTQYYTSAGASAKTWDKTSATTLYAKWIAIAVTVTLNQQGGSGGTTSVTATYGSAMPTITIPTRSGYTFGGYFTGANGEGTQYYSFDGTSTRTWDKTSGSTLYAWWVGNYSFGFVPDDSLRNYNSLKDWPCAMYLGTTDTLDSGEAKTFQPGTTVYIHFAWRNNGLNTVSNPDIKFEILTSAMSVLATSSTTIERELDPDYATWGVGWTWGTIANLSHGSYILRLTLDPNELIEDVDRSDNVVTYAFNVDATGVKYAVTLDQQGGSGGSSSVTATFGSAMPSITVPTKPGYAFGGYYTSTGGGGTQYYTASGASARSWDKTSATTLYAKWTSTGYTITFNKQGGSGGTSSLSSVSYGSTMSNITVPTRSGYTFYGYYSSTGGSGTQYFNSSGVAQRTWDQQKDATLYAYWQGNTVRLLFDKQGGAGGDETIIVRYGSTVTSVSVPTRAGYKFGGYYSGTSGSGTQYYSSTGAGVEICYLTAQTTLYAYWIQYMVIDLSGGTSASSYGVSYLSAPPSGGWTDTYKTTRLVLRYIEPGTFTMGARSTDYAGAKDIGVHQVTLTKGYWMGVFELTQRQWELVMGTKPSKYYNTSYYATRPVENVNYNMIRGSSSGAQWPTSSSVDSSSFFGVLRKKTGLSKLDLPTEAEWEYACRAGTTTALNSGKNLSSDFGACSEMNEVARYGGNWTSLAGDGWGVTTSKGTNKVGCYLPNEWGLYDMHGNVQEWCLDWYGPRETTAVSDPVGATKESSAAMFTDKSARRIAKGGSYNEMGAYCRSGTYDRWIPDETLNGFYHGLRVALRP